MDMYCCSFSEVFDDLRVIIHFPDESYKDKVFLKVSEWTDFRSSHHLTYKIFSIDIIDTDIHLLLVRKPTTY